MVPQNSSIRIQRLGRQESGVTVKGSLTDTFALWAAAKAGVNFQTIPVGAAGTLPAFKSGQVDAIVLWAPLTFRYLVSGEARSIATLDKEMEPTLPDSWVASQKMIDEQPRALQGVLKAIYMATNYMQRNREESLRYLKNFTEENDDRVVAMEYDIEIMKASTDGAIKREWVDGALNLARLARVGDLPTAAKYSPTVLYR